MDIVPLQPWKDSPVWNENVKEPIRAYKLRPIPSKFPITTTQMRSSSLSPVYSFI